MLNLGQNLKWWFGVIEDRNDPLKVGRVRVRVFDYHTANKGEIPTEDLPWAQPIQDITSAAIGDVGQSPTGLVEGSWVVGFWMDSEYQRPIILGSIAGMPTDFSNPGLGFNDPKAQYPKRINEPDSNRLTRNDKNLDGVNYDHPVVEKKNNTLTKNVPTALGSSWSEPESKYKAEYPFNHVKETESGHIKEYDDTPEAERIHEYHKSGTFYEIDADGNKVTRIVKNNYTVIAGSDYIKVAGEVDITSDATIRLKAPAVKIDAGSLDIKVGTYTLETGDSHHTYGGVKWDYIGSDTHLVEEKNKIDYTCPTDRTGKIDCGKPKKAS